CVRSRRPSSPLFPYTTLFRSLLPSLPPEPSAVATSGLRTLSAAVGLVMLAPCPITATAAVLSFLTQIGAFGQAECAVCIAHMQRSEENTSELQSRFELVCRLL